MSIHAAMAPRARAPGGPRPLGARDDQPAPRAAHGSATTASGQRERTLLRRWVWVQRINLKRHADSLRAFTKDEFGTGAAAPSIAHVEAVNAFIGQFRSRLQEAARWVDAAATMAEREPT